MVTMLSMVQSIRASRNFLWYCGSPMSLSQSATQRWSNPRRGLATLLTASSTAKRSFLQCKVLTMPICCNQIIIIILLLLCVKLIYGQMWYSRFSLNSSAIRQNFMLTALSMHIHTFSLPTPPLSLLPSFITNKKFDTNSLFSSPPVEYCCLPLPW